MFRSLLLTLLLVVASIGSPITLTKSSSGYQFTVTYGDFSVTDVLVKEYLEDGSPIMAEFTKVQNPELHANGEVGAPLLLSKTFDIAVENDEVSVSYTILDADTLDLANALYPKQLEMPISMAGQKPPYFAYAPESYRTTTDNPVTVGSYYSFRTQRAATVSVNPMLYNAEQKQLILIKSMSVNLTMEAPRMLRTAGSSLFEKVMRKQFLNLNGAIGCSVPTEAIRSDDTYLIIATADYIDNPDLKRLIDYRSDEFTIELVNSSTITATKDGFKEFIRGKMPTFCLLVGAPGDFPQHSHSYAQKTCKSVSYYVSTAGATPNPDISLGVFFVNSGTEIKNVVDKIIATEANNDDNPKVFVGVGGNTQPMQGVKADHCDRIVEQMYNDFFKPEDFEYVSSYSVHSGSQTCVQACNAGARVFNYNGHGQVTGWDYGWGNNNLSSLTNDIYPFVLSCACLTGTFDRGCMGQKYAYGEKGAVAFMGAYENSYGGQHGLNYGFCEALTDLEVERVGLAFLYGQNCWTSPNSTVGMPSDNGNMTMMQYQYHLFGDPATRVMTSKITDPYVKVVSPNGGEEWGQYSTREIRWNSNQKEQSVVIELHKGGSLVETLAASTENDGSFEWQIPEDQEVGTGYSIVIKTITGDALEDESDATFEIITEEIVTEYPYVQNFDAFQPKEGFSPGTGKEGYDTATIAMEGWTQCSDDELEVLSIMGATPSHVYAYPTLEGTGTDGDHTSGSGVYLYTESSAGSDNMEASILSPVFDMSVLGDPTLEYFLHMRSDSARPGEHHLDICVDGEWTKDIVVDTEEHGSEWFKKEVALREYVQEGKRVQFKVRTITGPAWDSDICFDDFKITGLAVPIASKLLVKDSFSMQVHNAMVSFTIPTTMAGEKLTLTLYNVQGRVVETLYSGIAKAGLHRIPFAQSANSTVASGFYLCRIEAGDVSKTVNLVLK